MASQSGGFGIGIPGLASDGAGGVVISGGITAGDPNAALLPTFHILFGATWLRDSPGNQVDGDPILLVDERATLIADGAPAALAVRRHGTTDGHTYGSGAIDVMNDAGIGALDISAQRVIKTTEDFRTEQHLLGRTEPLVPVAGPGLGTAPPAPTVSGSDVAGILSLGTGTLPTANSTLVTVNFGTAYALPPAVILGEIGAALAAFAARLYVSAVDATGFTVGFTGTLTASQAVGTYQIAYQVIGTS